MDERPILIVEDNAIQREGLAVVLRQQGYAVSLAADGREALGLIRSGLAPCLILLDMMMPVARGDGWHFLEERKRLPELARVPVVITTALGVESPEWADGLGASGLLRKPLDVEPLLAQVKQFC